MHMNTCQQGHAMCPKVPFSGIREYAQFSAQSQHDYVWALFYDNSYDRRGHMVHGISARNS